MQAGKSSTSLQIHPLRPVMPSFKIWGRHWHWFKPLPRALWNLWGVIFASTYLCNSRGGRRFSKLLQLICRWLQQQSESFMTEESGASSGGQLRQKQAKLHVSDRNTRFFLSKHCWNEWWNKFLQQVKVRTVIYVLSKMNPILYDISYWQSPLHVELYVWILLVAANNVHLILSLGRFTNPNVSFTLLCFISMAHIFCNSESQSCI